MAAANGDNDPLILVAILQDERVPPRVDEALLPWEEVGALGLEGGKLVVRRKGRSPTAPVSFPVIRPMPSCLP